jgi:hypothetical protein
MSSLLAYAQNDDRFTLVVDLPDHPVGIIGAVDASSALPFLVQLDPDLGWMLRDQSDHAPDPLKHLAVFLMQASQGSRSLARIEDREGRYRRSLVVELKLAVQLILGDELAFLGLLCGASKTSDLGRIGFDFCGC